MKFVSRALETGVISNSKRTKRTKLIIDKKNKNYKLMPKTRVEPKFMFANYHFTMLMYPITIFT